MNFKVYIFLIFAFAIFFSCSEGDEVEKIVPVEISYVHEDGSPILAGECINPDSKYAIAITTKLNKKRSADKPTNVLYTVNGIEHVMTFFDHDTQLNSVVLVNGINQAQIVGTEYKAQISYYSHDDFELVK
jgi:hypothetical protein